MCVARGLSSVLECHACACMVGCVDVGGWGEGRKLPQETGEQLRMALDARLCRNQDCTLWSQRLFEGFWEGEQVDREMAVTCIRWRQEQLKKLPWEATGNEGLS